MLTGSSALAGSVRFQKAPMAGIRHRQDIVMPVLNANLKATTLAAHHHLSFEQQVCAWLSSAGWEVLVRLVDHGRKTDLVIADDEDYYRIQVKSVHTRDPHVRVENKWQGARLDYVIYFSTLAEWGFIAPAFPETSRPLNAPGHVRFHAQRTNFLKAFTRVS
jgi:hypothetical protein